MPRLKKSVEAWFPVPDDPDKGETLIVHLEDGEESEIIAAATEMTSTFDSGRLVRSSRLRVDEENKGVLLRAVKDWKNYFDEDGNELPCTQENILRFAKFTWFAKHIKDSRQALKKQVAEERGELKKTLPPTPSGSQA